MYVKDQEVSRKLIIEVSEFEAGVLMNLAHRVEGHGKAYNAVNDLYQWLVSCGIRKEGVITGRHMTVANKTE